ncbi:MAG: D-alanyl-D-alanine carboxypeptidase/D-alanyl-D-alanine-endopeptidase [Candidatus Koribacter versatilis]|uniref:D-alanyl-D-alanine carboxypeptidase/D-alanyl-D-alanine-endopeptidase n=1 Tax=Candidatus Korobacter versatilis TaxID=658062 RepID=A0A932A7S8_9BACT|nr:D-alanyl-D-alanine carboxypeptidase/D-alanyl-D-alanine-endopeptidase [Candidatus Koribacter versatilis]
MSRKSALFLMFSLVLALAAAPAFAAKPEPLAKKIAKLLAGADASRGFWGIEVVSLTSGKTLYEANADKLFTPASNTKLFTTAATFALIGPEFRFKTDVETTGAIDKYGRLTGDLVLVGRGDPNLSGRLFPYAAGGPRQLPAPHVLEDLADELVKKGLKFVDGDVVADDSYFPAQRWAPGWEQDDLVTEYGAPVSALTINDNVVYVRIMPADRPGEKAFIAVEPFADYYKLDNRVITTPPGTGPNKITISRELGSSDVLLWGTIPQDDPGGTQAIAINDPAEFAAQWFRQLLERRGVVIYGRERTHHTEMANLTTFTVTSRAAAGGGTPGATTMQPLILAAHDSLPLAEDLKLINKISQNLHAELMLRLLGRERGTAGTIDGGLEVLNGFLAKAGITPGEYTLLDGSGMSRQNLVTPRATVKLLKYAATQPWGDLYRATLPIGGADGTLANRFRGTPAENHVHAKTGSLGHVNALSGYLETMKGDRIAFAIFANNHNLQGRKATETIDQIVQAIAEDVALPTNSGKKKK